MKRIRDPPILAQRPVLERDGSFAFLGKVRIY
jgi:hypothetical protein